MINSERWPVLYCDANALKTDEFDTVAQSSQQQQRPVYPALKLEMSWTPMEYYDAFDVRFKFGIF